MTNHPPRRVGSIRMTKQFRMTNDETSRSHAPRGNDDLRRSASRAPHWSFVICHWSFVRHSGFLIRHSWAVLLLLMPFGARAQDRVHFMHAGKLPPGAV